MPVKKVVAVLVFLLIGAAACPQVPEDILHRSCILPPSSYLRVDSRVTGLSASARSAIVTRWGALSPDKDGILVPSKAEGGETCEGQRMISPGRPLTEKEIKLLEMAGIEVLGYIPVDCYLVRGGEGRLEGLSKEWKSMPFSFLLKIDPMLYRTEWPAPPIVSVALSRRSRSEDLLEFLSARFNGIEKVSAFAGREQVIRLFYGGPDLKRLLRDIALRDDVIYIEPWFLPEPLNNNSVYVVQSYDTLNKTNYPVCATVWNRGITGTGEITAVCDTGLDSDMCFFRLSADESSVTDAQYPDLPGTGALDMSKKIIAYDVLPGASAYDGTCASWHGTGVVSCVAGDNYLTLSTPSSGGHDNGDGMAPNAKIFFQGAGPDPAQCLIGLSNDWQLIFGQAYDAGSRIHNNSWGTGVRSLYDADSRAVDIFSYDHEDFLFFFAAGNGGSLGPCTIDSPANAKNVLAVGATVNGSAGANTLASFSGLGPAADGRRKPDLVAPGYTIVSAYGDSDHFSDNCAAWNRNGTSFASPTAAGAATLLRQYLRDGFYPTGAASVQDSIHPSAALMKAVLINGAVQMSAATQDAILDSLDPDFSQGWGRLLLDTALFFSEPSRESRGLRVWDKWNGAGLTTGAEDEYSLDIVSSGEPLKITVAWTEPPPSPLSGVALCHDLDLEAVSPAGEVFRGNSFDQGGSYPFGVKDSVNNVEELFISEPGVGTWTLRVRGAHVPYMPGYEGSDRQGYALVATFADCGGCSLSVSSLGASDNGVTGIVLDWPAVTGASGYQVYRASGGCPADADTFRFIGTSSADAYTDDTAEGGNTYSYMIRAVNSCGEGPASPCASSYYSGSCSARPSFGGIQQAERDGGGGCSIILMWPPGFSNCPAHPEVSYNIYRSSSPYERPSAATLLTAGLTGTEYADSLVFPNETYFYRVRAEDGSSGNGGPANGGNEDENEAVLFATAHSGSHSYGTFYDGGGDGNSAKLLLEDPWRVTATENHTVGGSFSYHNAPDFLSYPMSSCAAAVTEELHLEPSSSPVLSYYVNYNLERGYDGCVVEISTDGGSSWTAITPAEGYPGTFSSTGTPPLNACGYLSTQGAFTGPAGNGAPSGWTLYSHDLSSYSGSAVRIRWVFSSDGGTYFEGIYLDDITVTHASNYRDCSGSDGSVALAGTSFNCADTIEVELYDADLTGAGSCSATVKSGSEPSGESVTLAEDPPSSGRFGGTILTTSDPAAADGRLSLSDGDLLTAEYTDLDDGSGHYNIVKRARATAVCVPPGEIAAGFQPYDIQSFWQDKETQVWPACEDAGSYKLYRGTLADLPGLLGAGGGSCVYDGIFPTASCPESPASETGRLLWYLVIAVNAAGEGSAGQASSGPRVMPAGSCP
ncbi:MAG TPA: S8 family serine peptidase [Acidobacteriota bacterium]|nr:S8 family serine peptidase [Acidobacteriota bacterium]HQQ47382.1 S8 family serine peptidase [Acidobacteriota bacterium]